MPYTPLFDTSSVHTGAASVSSISWNHILGVGFLPYLVVAISSEVSSGSSGNLPITAVTYGGVGMAHVLTRTWSGSGSDSRSQSVEIWVLDSNDLPTPGSHAVNVTFTGAVDCCDAAALSFFSIKKAAPEASASSSLSGAGGSITISTNITSLTDNAMLVEVTGCQNGATFSGVGSGQTQDVNNFTSVGSGHAIGMSHKLAPTAGAYSMSETNSNGESMGQIAISLVYLAPAGGGVL